MLIRSIINKLLPIQLLPIQLLPFQLLPIQLRRIYSKRENFDNMHIKDFNPPWLIFGYTEMMPARIFCYVTIMSDYLHISIKTNIFFYKEIAKSTSVERLFQVSMHFIDSFILLTDNKSNFSA